MNPQPRTTPLSNPPLTNSHDGLNLNKSSKLQKFLSLIIGQQTHALFSAQREQLWHGWCSNTHYSVLLHWFHLTKQFNSAGLSWTGQRGVVVHDPTNPRAKLQALVYDILPSTTAVFSYAIGSRKLSANEQFFVGAQTAVRLLQTTQIKQGVSFIAANKVYTIANKTTIVWIVTELFFFFFFFFIRGGCVSCLHACLGARLLLQSY